MGNRQSPNLPPLRERMAMTALDERRERNWKRTTRAIGEYCDQRDDAYDSRDAAWDCAVDLRAALAACLTLLITVTLWAIFSGCAIETECPPDAAPVDAAPTCGATWDVCCANDAPGGRCNAEAICNVSGICEPMCFPYCSDAGDEGTDGIGTSPSKPGGR